jgi:ABC-type sugar transport system substrate-binding protein
VNYSITKKTLFEGGVEMKRSVLFVSLFILVFAIGAFGAEKPKKVVVGLSWNEKMHSLIQAWEDYMKQYSKEYGKEHGIEFKWIINVADSNPSQQASNIEDLINQGVDVIIARAHDAAAIGASVRAAHEADIAFVTFDRESSTQQPDAHVGADSYNQAISTAEHFAKLLKKQGIKGKAIELMGDLRDMNAVYRSKGWHKVEEEQGVWETIIKVPTEWNPEKFMTGTTNALQAHPEANCMFIASDFCFSAVQAALENAGRWAPAGQKGHMWIAAQDVNPQGYEAMAKGYIDVATTYDAYFHAVEAVKVIARLAAKEDLGGKKFLVPGRVATPENVKEMKYIWARDYKD